MYNLPAPQQPKPCGRWVARRPGDVCSATTEAERRPQDIRGMSALRRPKQNGVLGPMGACHATTEALRKMGCKTSGGRLFCNDRSGAETARHPGDVCSAPTEAKRSPWTHGRLPRNNRSLAEDGLQDVRGTSVLQRPKRSGDLGPMGTRSASASKIKKG